MACVLLIEDELANQMIVKSALAPHQVLIAKNLQEARQTLDSNRVDLILLDVQLPDGDGFSFFMEIQSQISEQEIPVVFLTGRNQETDKVTGYTLGADDYVTKPIHPMVFKALIEGKLRKRILNQSKSKMFQKDGFSFDLDRQRVTFENKGQAQSLELTTLEFKLLLYLLKHKDHVLSREQLIQDVWGGSLNISDRTIDTHMSHLRKRLVGTSLAVQSVYGAGYKLKAA